MELEFKGENVDRAPGADGNDVEVINHKRYQVKNNDGNVLGNVTLYADHAEVSMMCIYNFSGFDEGLAKLREIFRVSDTDE